MIPLWRALKIFKVQYFYRRTQLNTFLIDLILTKTRSTGRIALAVASATIAATYLVSPFHVKTAAECVS